MSSGKLQGFKQDEGFCTALIKCTTKIYPDLPYFSAGVTSAKVGAEEQVFAIPVALLRKLGKGLEKEIRELLPFCSATLNPQKLRGRQINC